MTDASLEGLLKARVLIIDDISFYRSLVKQSLDMHGFKGEIDNASSIKEAFEKIKDSILSNKNYNLIITDLHLTDGKGTALSKKIRTTKQTENIPVVIISTESQQDLIIQAIAEFGVDAYVIKPIEPDELFEKIKFAWNKRFQA